MLLFLGVLVALAAAVGLGFQIGLRRGLMLAAQQAEEQAIVTSILQIIAPTSTVGVDD